VENKLLLTEILSSNGTPIKVNNQEKLWLESSVQNRELRPFCLAWERIRRHPDLQIEGGTEEEQEAIWADRKKFFIQGWNAPILMNDKSIVRELKPEEKVIKKPENNLII
jgi:hypothetical protein